jgi:hypothetical protein
MKKILSTKIIVIVLLGILTIIIWRPKPNTENIPEVSNTEIQSTVSKEEKQFSEIALMAGELTLDLKFTPGQTLYEILIDDKNSELISINGKEHSGLGYFVTDIGTLHEGDGKYLMYYINDKEASFGISSYVPKNGDIIKWQLK